MTAKIYKPAKTAMQSGKARTKLWVLEFDPCDSRFNEPIMGWVGSSDMKQEVKLYFDTKEQAVEYAEKQGLDYRVIEPKKPKLIIKSYADNFKAT